MVCCRQGESFIHKMLLILLKCLIEKNLFNACYLLLKCKYQTYRRWKSWTCCGYKLLRHICLVLLFKLLNLNVCCVRCRNESFHLFFSLKFYVGTVMYCMTTFNNVLGNLALCVYTCVQNVRCLCKERTCSPVQLMDCWETDFCGPRSLSQMRVSLFLSLGVYFTKGRRGFYFSDCLNAILYVLEREKKLFSSAHHTCLCMW